MRWVVSLAFGAMLAAGTSAAAAMQCDRLVARLASQVADATCVESKDLTTNNRATTPLDNSLAGLPGGAFTPTTDRAVISPSVPDRTPITKAVPGVQLNAPALTTRPATTRILFRLFNQWNGKLVIAGASGTRSEFNGDFAWSDYVLQLGYAYVSQNKGVLNLELATASDPLGCRLNPSSAIFVHFYDNDAGQPFTRWTEFMNEAARIGKNAIAGYPGRYHAPHLCRRHLEWRLPSAAGAGDCTGALRWRGRLGRDLCRCRGAEYFELPAPGNSQLSRLCRLPASL